VNTPGQASDKPWLRNSHWASRTLLDHGGVGWTVLGLAYLVGGAILLVVLATAGEPDAAHPIFGLALVLLVVVALARITRVTLRNVRYGDSVCRLITLPGVVGGWFKADVECGLPADAATVTVRLRNLSGGEHAQTLWSMEQPFAVAPMPGKAARSIVNVRLRVPRHPSQEPFSPQMRFVLGAPIAGIAWVLEIEKKSPGFDFFSTFAVPIYDTRDAPPHEQLDELSAPR
jgi:hypothetical protein